MPQVLILCPVYNDAEAFLLFEERLAGVAAGLPAYRFSLLVVDDGSHALPRLTTRLPGQLLLLHRNIGHQPALATGMAYAQKHCTFDHLIVMDGDGEDRPEDLQALLEGGREGEVVLARRASRQEGRSFRTFYAVYKRVFRLLTGRGISFGNFMQLPRTAVDRLVYYPEINLHLAGTVLKAGLPRCTVPAHRGKRLAGRSSMSFNSLLLHGLSALGVFLDIIVTRLMLFSLGLILLAALAALTVIGIRWMTDLAIPGWATTALSASLLLLLQGFMLSLFTLFLYLSGRSGLKAIPALNGLEAVREVQTLPA